MFPSGKQFVIVDWATGGYRDMTLVLELLALCMVHSQKEEKKIKDIRIFVHSV